MPEITGKLLADLHPNGTVRMVFLADTGGGNECPITAKNLDAAEMDFARTCGLTPERGAALRTELDRNKVVSVETCIDDAAKAKFPYARPGGCGRDWKFLLQRVAVRGRKVSPLRRPGIIGSRAVCNAESPVSESR